MTKKPSANKLPPKIQARLDIVCVNQKVNHLPNRALDLQMGEKMMKTPTLKPMVMVKVAALTKKVIIREAKKRLRMRCPSVPP